MTTTRFRISDQVRALAAIGAAGACFVTGEGLPVGLLPQMASSFHSSLAATGLLVTVYAFVVVLVSAPLTHLTREVPRRLILTGILLVFSAGTIGVVLAPDYGLLMAARIVTALAQALFWSVGPPAAAGLFAPEARARAIAGVFAGSAVAIVVGIPAGTWLGQRAGWWVPFLVLAGIGLLAAGAAARLLPPARPSDNHATTGAAPDRRRYWTLISTTVLTVTAFYTAFTYITAFLTRVSGIARHDVALVLLIGGIASTVGLQLAGAVHARRPALATVVPVAAVTLSLLGMWALGSAAPVAVALQALDSFALGAFIVTAQTGVLVFAPKSTDLATAGYSASFNLGIGAGPAIGAVVLAGAGVRATALVGAAIGAAALANVVRIRGAAW